MPGDREQLQAEGERLRRENEILKETIDRQGKVIKLAELWPDSVSSITKLYKAQYERAEAAESEVVKLTRELATNSGVGLTDVLKPESSLSDEIIWFEKMLHRLKTHPVSNPQETRKDLWAATHLCADVDRLVALVQRLRAMVTLFDKTATLSFPI